MAIDPNRSPLDGLMQQILGRPVTPPRRSEGVDGELPRRPLPDRRAGRAQRGDGTFSSEAEVAGAKSRIRDMLARNLFGPDMLERVRAHGFAKLQPLGQIIDIRI